MALCGLSLSMSAHSPFDELRAHNCDGRQVRTLIDSSQVDACQPLDVLGRGIEKPGVGLSHKR
jgi:hypothetical protein